MGTKNFRTDTATSDVTSSRLLDIVEFNGLDDLDNILPPLMSDCSDLGDIDLVDIGSESEATSDLLPNPFDINFECSTSNTPKQPNVQSSLSPNSTNLVSNARIVPSKKQKRRMNPRKKQIEGLRKMVATKQSNVQSSLSPNSSSVVINARLVPPKKQKRRTPRKKQIEDLREMVAVLSEELRTTKMTSSIKIHRKLDSAQFVWKSIATRQRELRLEAEVNNASLRRLLQIYKTEFKDMRRMFKRRMEVITVCCHVAVSTH